MRSGSPDDTTPEQSPTALPGRSRVCDPASAAPGVTGLAFPPHVRVRRGADYQAGFAEGKRVSGQFFRLHARATAAPPRMGVSVSRKTDPNAVGRNRIKRQAREAFRHLRPLIASGDFIFVAKREARDADNAALRADLERLYRRAGALPPPPALGTMPADGAAPAAPTPAPATPPGPATS